MFKKIKKFMLDAISRLESIYAKLSNLESDVKLALSLMLDKVKSEESPMKLPYYKTDSFTQCEKFLQEMPDNMGRYVGIYELIASAEGNSVKPRALGMVVGFGINVNNYSENNCFRSVSQRYISVLEGSNSKPRMVIIGENDHIAYGDR